MLIPSLHWVLSGPSTVFVTVPDYLWAYIYTTCRFIAGMSVIFLAINVPVLLWW